MLYYITYQTGASTGWVAMHLGNGIQSVEELQFVEGKIKKANELGPDVPLMITGWRPFDGQEGA